MTKIILNIFCITYLYELWNIDIPYSLFLLGICIIALVLDFLLKNFMIGVNDALNNR